LTTLNTANQIKFRSQAHQYFFIKIIGPVKMVFAAPLGMTVEMTNNVLQSLFNIQIGRFIFEGHSVQDFNNATLYTWDDPLFATARRIPIVQNQEYPSQKANEPNKSSPKIC
ncbi:MAG: hypothetical protein KIT56_11560, partial [Gammaproteobacteria bacterium]|nr:hypothetical protein [Gammaproteobacteria bacterium]MCW5584483.1 hypothetical protein [Gammaproteobacteria bacterium]